MARSAIEAGLLGAMSVSFCAPPVAPASQLSMWILPVRRSRTLQYTKFIPNKESEKLLHIRTCFLIGWDRNPTIPRARIPDDRLL